MRWPITSVMTLGLLLSSPLPAQVPVVGVEDPEALFVSDDPLLHRNKQATLHIMRELISCNQWDRADEWLTERYIQHNPNATSGRDNIIRYFREVWPGERIEPCEELTMEVSAVMAEGDYVTVIWPWRFPDPRNPGETYTTTGFDTWKFVDGKADEHWDPAPLDIPRRPGAMQTFLDGTDRAVDSTTRGIAGRAAWTAAVGARSGSIAMDDFNGVNIDVPVGVETSVGHFSVYYEHEGDYSDQAGNTAPIPHPTGTFVGTTGTGGGDNAETIEGLEIRYDTRGPVTETLELRFDPPIFAWSADVYSIDGLGFGEGYTPDSIDHTTMHVLDHSFDFAEIFEYAGGGYSSFFGIVSDVPFSSISFTAEGDGDRFRMDNVAIAR